MSSANTTSIPLADPDAPLKGTSRYIDGDGLAAIVWSTFAVATTFLTLRLAVRWRQHRAFLSDDYWIIWAWLCYLTMSIIQMEQMSSLQYTIYLEAGRIAPSQEALVKTVELAKWEFPIIKLFWTTLWSVKASFLAIFYRMIKPFDVFRRIWYAIAIFTFLAYIGIVLSSILTCDPPGRYFKAASCNTPRELWHAKFNVIFSTTLDIASDLMIMALPLAILPTLRLDSKKKIGLAVVFSITVITICAAIARMTQVIKAGKDEPVDLAGLAIWGVVETATAVIVGSLPPLKAFFARGVKRYQSYKKSNQSNSGRNELPALDRTPSSKLPMMMNLHSIPLDGVAPNSPADGPPYVQKPPEAHLEDGLLRDDMYYNDFLIGESR